MSLKIHHGGELMYNEQTMYEGEKYDELKINFDTWSYFKLVGILKELGYSEVDTIYYKDPIFGMNVLNDDKGALDIADLCRVHISIDVYIQHSLSQPEYVEGSLLEEEEEGLNDEDIVNFEEEYLISKLYKEVVMRDNVQDEQGGDVYVGEGLNDAEMQGLRIQCQNDEYKIV